MFLFALYIAKVANWGITFFNLGTGSTWPGHIALKLYPDFLKQIVKKNTVKVVLIAGTNGKTTTSLLITHGLKKKGHTVITNPEGANLLNGITSAFIRGADTTGHISAQYAVFESDENAFSLILEHIKEPSVIVLLNVFRDQLDRYGEVHSVIARWKKSLHQLTTKTTLIINGDDPQLAYLGSEYDHSVYFGAEKSDITKKDSMDAVDSTFCPQCGTKLKYAGISYSHLGVYSCPKCGFHSPTTWSEHIDELPHFKGIYNKYNMRASLLVLHTLLKEKYEDIWKTLSECKPAFGRQESIQALGKNWLMILSKNPVGFNQSIDAIKELLSHKKSSVIIILNDRIPDGTDVSWIWDVDFEKIWQSCDQVTVSGDRTYDMAIRMQNSHPDLDIKAIHADPDLKTALHTVAHHHQSEQPILVLATYTGMLDARNILVGRKLL
jgi:UDP-N-acetylmuramyl tripeptide synthase